MTITSIQSSAGRTFNHPHEPYANFRFDIHLKAEIPPEDQEPQFVDVCVRELQDQAERLAEERKAAILERCEMEYEREQLRYQIKSLSRPMEEWEKGGLETEATRAADLEKAKARMITLLQKLCIPTSDEPCLHPGHPDHPETHERD